MKISIVHDWFDSYMGSEKCVESFTNIFPEADIFSLVDFLSDFDKRKIVKNKEINTSFIQSLPFAKSFFRHYLPLFPLAIEQLDISGYDVILSSSHAFAKGVLTNTQQKHFCYCHTPIRYIWDLYFQYLKESNIKMGIKGLLIRYLLHKIRLWDSTTPNRVDYFIANSNFIARRINKVYNRKADVIFPPVDIDKFTCEYKKDNYYLAVSRFVPYKKIDLIVEAFSHMPDKKLVVIGSGPDEKKIKLIAKSNIHLIGHQPFEELKKYMQNARAFVFAAEEDFGITNVELQACGTPVIAYGVGGSAETVKHLETGILFNKQTPEDIINAVSLYEKNIDKFDSKLIHNHTLQFSRSNFESNIKKYIEDRL